MSLPNQSKPKVGIYRLDPLVSKEELDKKFGKGKWKLYWSYGNGLMLKDYDVLIAYEEAYRRFLIGNPEMTKKLIANGFDIYYRNSVDDVTEKTRYGNAQTYFLVAIRRCLICFGHAFLGKTLIKIDEKSEFSQLLPSNVPFHSWIAEPEKEFEGVKKGSVTSWFRNNIYAVVEEGK
jgi:hypothetical protein